MSKPNGSPRLPCAEILPQSAARRGRSAARPRPSRRRPPSLSDEIWDVFRLDDDSVGLPEDRDFRLVRDEAAEADPWWE